MPHVTMSREDAEKLAARSNVEVRDPDGNLLGTIGHFMPEWVAAQVRAHRDDPRPGIPSADVRERLGLSKEPACTD